MNNPRSITCEKGQTSSGISRRGFLKGLAGFGAAFVGGALGGFFGSQGGAITTPSENNPTRIPTPPIEIAPPSPLETSPPKST